MTVIETVIAGYFKKVGFLEGLTLAFPLTFKLIVNTLNLGNNPLTLRVTADMSIALK